MNPHDDQHDHERKADTTPGHWIQLPIPSQCYSPQAPWSPHRRHAPFPVSKDAQDRDGIQHCIVAMVRQRID
jgi:hypothetical protein